MRRVLTWVFLILAGAMLFPITAAAQSPITMEVNALYNGASKYGEWLPVVVYLENSGDDLNGQVQVLVTASGEQTTYAQRLELPRGSRKQVTIYTVPNNFSRRLEVAFFPEGEEEALVSQQVDIRPVPNVRYIAATVTGSGEGLETMAGLDFRAGTGGASADSTLVPLTLETLPERPEALRTLDMIVFSGVDTSVLTPAQRAALEQYVALGGMIMLGGGPEANRVLAGIPDTLRPVTLSGETALATLPALEEITGSEVRVSGPFPAAVAEPFESASVRFEQDGQPLVVEREVGQGAVLWLALDPALSPFDAWAGADEFWLALVGERGAYPSNMPVDVSERQMLNEQLFYALQNLPSLDLPSLRLLVPLLGFYILIVGPVNYLALRRTRRMELAWITIPVITLLFGSGAYALGYQLRGSDVIVNQVAIVQGVPGGEGGYIRSVIGVFSPARRSYDLSIASESLVSPSRVQGDPFATGTSQRQALIVQGEPSRVENLTVNQWSMQSITAEATVAEGFGFDAALSSADGALVGTITNRSDYSWQDVVVVLGSQFHRVGDIAPGESKEIEFKVQEAGEAMMSGDVAWRIFEPEFNRPNGAPRDIQVRQQILSSLYNGPFGVSPLGTSSLPVLLAWVEGAPIEVELADDSRVSHLGTTLLYARMPVRFGAGEVSLPRGMMAGRIVENDGGTCYGQGQLSLTPDFREAIVEWEVPSEVKGIEPTGLSVYVNTDGGWFNAPPLELYDFQADTWRLLEEPALGRNDIEEPGSYLSESGVVRLRVQSERQNQGGCLFFDLSMEGTLAASPAEALAR